MRTFVRVAGALFTVALVSLVVVVPAHAQGVTTAAISGVVVDANGNPVPNARIVALHVPSGTRYEGVSRTDGRVVLPGMRVGGPYTVTVTAVGLQPAEHPNVFLTLGVATDLRFTMRQAAIQLTTIEVAGEQETIFSSDRTGAATSVSRANIEGLPTISRRVEDFARLTPQYSGTGFGYSFAGQDNRLNNTTVDGSYFNNSFGLAGQPGDRTGVAPISIDAIEQVQVNVAPYDVRQGNFVGAGVNSVTRSGTNNLIGTLYYQYRNNNKFFVGTQAGANTFDPGTFRFGQIGASLSGPIVRDKLFLFANFENGDLTAPGTTFRANTGVEPVTGSVTRVLSSDLDALSSYLATNFDYATGGYQGYDNATPATRFLARLDYNLSPRSKLSLRYIHLDSQTDVLTSNSSSLGFGTRRTNSNGLNFQNSNYIILENIRSFVAEWNTMIGANKSNSLILGYTYQDESRDSRGTFFPMVDVLETGSVYTTFGFEPFTPNNELRYSSFQLQNNFTVYGARHTLTFGASAERYESENVFFPGSQSAYVYNSLADFYTDANDYLANPNRTTSPVTLNRFQVRWSNIPGQDKPIQPLEVFYTGIYAQDEWQASANLRFTAGVRADVPFFGNTGFANTQVPGLTFRDETGATVQYATDKLPDANILFSPRLGFNLDVTGTRTTQIRGGTGIFSGRPAYVWISNQIGNNGVLTGFERQDNTTARPFNPDPDFYKPTNVTGAPASSYELALTDPGFRFPQLWRSNIGVDQRLPGGLNGTAEFMYSRDVNGVYYINANLAAPDAAFTGPDTRPRWTAGNRINANIDNAVVLKNENVGRSWNVAFSLERPLTHGFYAKAAYSYGRAENTVDAGSIAFGSWNNNPHAGDPNNPGLGLAATSPGNRVFLALSYRREYFSFGATSISIFWEGANAGRASYVFSGDLNGDGGTSNDLIYIPANQGEMNFEPYTVTVSGAPVTFTAADQATAFESFIAQDEYLSAHRGEYAQRGGALLPMTFRTDLSIAQDLFTDVSGLRNRFQVRLDIFNFLNLLSSDRGVGERFVTTSPLIARGADGSGAAQYRLRNLGSSLISESRTATSGVGDVYRVQLSLRYNFN